MCIRDRLGAYEKGLDPLPQETIEAIRDIGVALKGPTTTPKGGGHSSACLLYTSDAADDLLCVDLGGRRIIKKKKQKTKMRKSWKPSKSQARL